MRPRRDSLGEIMRTKIQRLVLLGMLVGGLLVALSTPANAATNQISGVAVLDTTGACPPPPAGYEDFTDFTQVMTGIWTAAGTRISRRPKTTVRRAVCT